MKNIQFPEKKKKDDDSENEIMICLFTRMCLLNLLLDMLLKLVMPLHFQHALLYLLFLSWVTNFLVMINQWINHYNAEKMPLMIFFFFSEVIRFKIIIKLSICKIICLWLFPWPNFIIFLNFIKLSSCFIFKHSTQNHQNHFSHSA